MSDASSRARWRAASSLDELCALGAEFIAGHIECFPGWGAEALDRESDAISAALLRLNRAGWWTSCSQPGAQSREGRVARRAFVCGFASESLAAALMSAAGDGFEVRVVRAADAAREPLAVTIEEGEVRVAIGGPAHAAEAECCADALAPELLREFARWPYVCAWCRSFGDEGPFWKALVACAEGARP